MTRICEDYDDDGGDDDPLVVNEREFEGLFLNDEGRERDDEP